MRISELHRAERPRERLSAQGPAALGDAELLAILLRTGYAGCGAVDLARDLLRRHPAGALARLSLVKLRKIKGMGLSRAAMIVAAVELAKRWTGSDADREASLDNPARVCDFLLDIRGQRKEHFVAFYLNARHRLLHRETVSIGTLTVSLVHPREVFSPAVERKAAAVIVVHNHPSDDCRPSPEDKEMTQRLAQAGRLLGIDLVDHVLVTGSDYFSFRENGLLP